MRLLPAAALLCLLLAACSQPSEPVVATPSVPAAAPADAAQAVLEASQRFGQLRSFQARLQLKGPRTLEAGMTFVAPDRYRLETEAGAQTIIDGTFFLQQAGEVRQIPVPPEMLAQWRSPIPADAVAAELQVEDLGPETVAGQATRKYRVRHASAAPDGMLYWINAEGLPVRIERQGQTNGQPFQATVSYSRFNDPTLQVALP
ncbi:hypothetical protein [Stenotrophomonas sp. 278]|uniref:hypothetical protein n=1 Tax=Stenotrophomonas sp. 278 TaxID=2479851 RepID=UPI000F660A8F|nr:hypothetical protein [Stenotrophomonas sp. 278]RRU11215.1 hypothetical protein EGJ34_13730 [Stenotrophomonas sp. 278]